MNVRLISMYTPDYAHDASGLIATAAEFRLSVHASMITQRSWAEAVRYKPEFIHQCIEAELSTANPADGILWIDADARIRRMPEWDVFEDVDLAVSRFQWSRQHTREMLTGTVFMRCNPMMWQFSGQWMNATKKVAIQADTPEQTSLEAVYKKHAASIRFKELGIEWTWFDGPAKQKQNRNKRPIIEHYQRSREMRRRKP